MHKSYARCKETRINNFRRLVLYHIPISYKGLGLVSGLSEVLISPKTGEFVHPGEHEQLKKSQTKGDYLHPPSAKSPLLPKENSFWHTPTQNFQEYQAEEFQVDTPQEPYIPNVIVQHEPAPQSKSSISQSSAKSRWKQYAEEKYPDLVPKDPESIGSKNSSEENS